MVATLYSAGQLYAQSALPLTAAGIASVEAADLEKISQTFDSPLGQAKNSAGPGQSIPTPKATLSFEENVGQFDDFELGAYDGNLPLTTVTLFLF